MRRSVVATLGAVLMACDGNTYVPPPPPEVTVAQPRRARGDHLQRVQRPHRVRRGGRHPRARAGLPEEHALHARDRGQQGRPALRHRARCSTARASSRPRRISQGAKAQAQAAEEQLAITRTIFERRRAAGPTSCRRRRRAIRRERAVAQAKATLEAAKLDLVVHAHLRADQRAHRPQLRRRRQPGRLWRGDAARVDRPPRSRSTPTSTLASASCSSTAISTGAVRRRRPAGERNRAYLGLVNEEGFPHEGMVDYVEQPRGSVDRHDRDARGLPESRPRDRAGAVRARARALHARTGLLVPDDAVALDQGGRYVLVVGDKDVVEHRRVEVGTARRRHADRSEGRGDRRLGRRERAPARAPGKHGQADARGRDGRRGGKMISRFFIDRPIFANVIAIVTVLFGVVAAVSACRSSSTRRSRRRRSGHDRTTPAPTPRSSPTPSPRRSSSRSTASRTCCTCPRPARATARTR